MNDLATARPARLITAFGTALYFDVASGELRHGPIESSPRNAVFVGDPSPFAPYHRGHLAHDLGGSFELIACRADRCEAASRAGGDNAAAQPTALQLIPLERGLIAFAANGAFLSAIPDGQLRLCAPVCSTWELFLASEAWCSEPTVTGDESFAKVGRLNFDKQRIQYNSVHPLTRVAASTQPRAKKILIYGYSKWSHGRVYYDLSKYLHRRGYIVDTLDWRVSHAEYFSKLAKYYDFFMTSLDGAPSLLDDYAVSGDRIIAVSHGEFDIRMLVEQKGVEIFDKFASYGVLSEFLFCASLTRGVPRPPMVASLGIDYSEFYSDISERLVQVGYAGSMSLKTYGIELKRGELAEAAAQEAGLPFRVAGSMANQIRFQDMPGFYREVDAVLSASISEGAGLPTMEAAAAGRLVIATPVGHFSRKAYEGGGIIAPVEAEKFKAFTGATLRYYKDNPAAYRDKCRIIQEAARKFDWQYSIGEWIELIEAPRRGPG